MQGKPVKKRLQKFPRNTNPHTVESLWNKKTKQKPPIARLTENRQNRLCTNKTNFPDPKSTRPHADPWKPLNNLRKSIAKPRPKCQLSPDPLRSLAFDWLEMSDWPREFQRSGLLSCLLSWAVPLCWSIGVFHLIYFVYSVRSTRMRTKNVARLGLNTQLHHILPKLSPIIN